MQVNAGNIIGLSFLMAFIFTVVGQLAGPFLRDFIFMTVLFMYPVFIYGYDRYHDEMRQALIRRLDKKPEEKTDTPLIYARQRR